MTWLEIAAFATLVLLALVGSYLDARYRVLPNLLCLAVLAGGLAFGLLLHGWPWAGSALLHAVLALLVGMGLFAAGMIGGGDAKYYAAFAAWFPLGQAVLLVLLVSVAGLVLVTVSWLAARRRIASSLPGRKGDFAKVPYGVAISVGCLLAGGLQLAQA